MTKYFTLSLALHFILLLLFVTNFIFPHDIQYCRTNRIATYISDGGFYQRAVPVMLPRHHKNNLPLNRALKSHKVTKLDKYSGVKPPAIFSNKLNQPLSLVAVLHDLIAAQIKYPPGIQLFGKKTVYLSFKLFPDGHIADITILQPSGVTFFDRAALEAISSLPKLTIAQKLLSRPERFNVPIEFASDNAALKD